MPRILDLLLEESSKNGHLDCVQYVHAFGLRNGVEPKKFNNMGCVYAADGGHLEVMQYLVENGFPIYPNVYLVAEAKGHTACMHYLRIKNLIPPTIMQRICNAFCHLCAPGNK